MSEYQKQNIKELAARILKQGYRVFIAKSGTYGFFTDKDGARVVSFQAEFSGATFSGNYKTDMPKQTGTGWRISDNDTRSYKEFFNAYPPRWAVGDSKWKFSTLAQHLDQYLSSSHYVELSS